MSQAPVRNRWEGPTVATAAAVVVLARVCAESYRALDKVWAEDGRVFLVDAREHGLGAFLYSYAGYGDLASRIEAAVGALLPLKDYAVFCSVAAATTVGILASAVRWAALEISGSRAVGLAAAAALVGAGPLAGESLATLSNLQWFLVPTAACLMLVPQPTAGQRRAITGFLLLTTLSSILPVVLLPLAAARGVRKVEWSSVAAIAVGLIAQVGFSAFSPVSSPDVQPARDTQVPPAFLRTVVEVTGGGSPLSSRLVGLVLLAALATVLGIGRSRHALLLAGSATGVLLITCIGSGAVKQRYVGCFVVMVLAAATIASTHVAPTIRRGSLAVVVALSLLSFPVSSFRASGPSWREQVRATAAGCARDAHATFAWAPTDFPPSRMAC